MGDAVGVGHPVESLSDVRRTEARSAGIDRPDGVVRTFQVSLYKVEPLQAVTTCNLLAKADDRSAGLDEPEEVRPQVSLVAGTLALACCRERLAWTGTGPNRPRIIPPGRAQGVGPDADSGEEVALGVACEVCGLHVDDGSFIYVSGSNQVVGNEVSQPLGCIRIDLVVVGATHSRIHFKQV